MAPVGNDVWTASILLLANTTYHYRVEAWHDRFGTWRADYLAKRKAGQATPLDLEEGATMVCAVDRQLLDAAVDEQAVLSDDVQYFMRYHVDRGDVTASAELLVIVDRLAAQYSAWYELFPRSQISDPK